MLKMLWSCARKKRNFFQLTCRRSNKMSNNHSSDISVLCSAELSGKKLIRLNWSWKENCPSGVSQHVSLPDGLWFWVLGSWFLGPWDSWSPLPSILSNVHFLQNPLSNFQNHNSNVTKADFRKNVWFLEKSTKTSQRRGFEHIPGSSI